MLRFLRNFTSGYDSAMMNPQVDIRALAKLARLEISDAEALKLDREIPSILAFVDTIQKARIEATAESPAHRNIMRADDAPHEGGIYTEKLLEAAPQRVGNRIAVKQVISRKK